MNLLQPLKKDIGYLKSGWQGGTGSGKTTTASLVAIGLHRHLKLKSPVAFYDSERGSGFVHDLFSHAKIDLVGVRSRSFTDLGKFMAETEKSGIDISIIDSITHPWRDLVSTARKRRGFISLKEWGEIKDVWAEAYTIRFLNSKMHILMCGREQAVYIDVEEDEDKQGRKSWKPIKVGTKMATEGETGFEPNFLVEMEKRMLNEGAAWARVANVIKDRSFRLDGMEKEFNMPMGKDGKPDLARLIEENEPFRFVSPHIESLDPAAGAVSVGVKTESSDELFNQDGQMERSALEQERELLLGNCEQLLHKYWPSRDKLSMKAKGDLLEGASWAMARRTRNWEFVQKKFKLDDVKFFYSLLDVMLTKERAKLDKSLALGVDGKGEIWDADAAAVSVRLLAVEVMKAQGYPEPVENDLPF